MRSLTGGRASEVIHDIRNKLAIARANIEAFIDGKLPPSEERLRAVLQSLAHIDNLFTEFSAYQPEPPPTVNATEINVCDLLDREYKAIGAIAGAKGVSLSVARCAVTADACAHFIGDPVRIGEIVTNVLTNAIRYTPKGGSVHIDCSRRAGELEISVSDTGPGINPGELPRIFEAGYRGTASENTDGSGIGLAIAEQFVRAHGGTITAAPMEPHGARFTIRLPGTVIPLGEGETPRCGHCSIARSR